MRHHMKTPNFQHVLPFIIWIICILLVACQPNEVNELKIGMVTYGSMPEKKQSRFLKALDDADISYFLHKQKEKNVIHHWPSDTAQFYGIERKIQYGSQLHFNIEELLITSGEKAKIYYTQAFDNAGIRYSIRRSFSDSSFWSLRYSQIYGPQVDQIRQAWELLKLEQKKSMDSKGQRVRRLT